MNNENHRRLCLEIFQKYQQGQLEVGSHLISENILNKSLAVSGWENYIYVLRLGKNAAKAPSLAAIANSLDPLQILYIGGHESGFSKGRALQMIKSGLRVQKFYQQKQYARNDRKHGHSVANYLTTSLQEAGFRIEDCVLDLVQSGQSHGFDEFELLVGYQETFHHLPPWNAKRGGVIGYREPPDN